MHENIQMLKLRLDQIRTKFKLTSGQAAQQTLLEKGKHVLSVVSEAIELVFGGQVVASGGFSVEYYTEGQHATQDIDLIINSVASNKELNELFLQLGFSQIGGRAWALDDIGVFIEKVDDSIFDGDYATITVDQLFNIKFVNVNDIIIDRVKGFVHWKVDNYQDQIIDLVLLNRDYVSFPYIKSKLNPNELKYWNSIENIIEKEDSIEEKLYHFESLLNKNNVIYSKSKLTNNDYVIWFPTSIDNDTIHFGLNIFDNFSQLLYNEFEDEYQLGKWPENLTYQWPEYMTIIKLMKEVLENGK